MRELEHIVQHTATLVRDGIIRPSDLPREILHHSTATQGTLAENLEVVERGMIVSALEKTDWVQTRAAKLLGISERVLRYKMKKGGIRKNGFH